MMSNATEPLITIIIATFNSESMLPRVLDAIRRQTIPWAELEVLFVDGGSTDCTWRFAEANDCRIIANPRTEPVNAKYLGFIAARGHFAVYLDHDEVLESPDSLAKKVALMKREPGLRAVVGSGYVNPPNYPFINSYINEFGEPFSFFIYRISKDRRFFLKDMQRKFQIKSDFQEGTVFDLTTSPELPLIELCAAGSMIDLDFFRGELAEMIKAPSDIPHLFYILQARSHLIGITKNDALIHYSSDTVAKYLNKIKWRVKNNIYHVDTMGESGFKGRARYASRALQLRRFLFLPYCASILFPLLDAIRLSLSRRSPLYLNHVWLSLYTGWLITLHLTLRTLGYRPRLRSYDESKVIVDS